jgi:DNA polymerase I
MGDKVDNVPGVPGIGPKTASQLIANMARSKRCSPMPRRFTKPKLKQSLIDHADAARLSRGWSNWCATRRFPSRSRSWRSRAFRRSRSGLPRRAGVQVAAQPAKRTGGPASGRSSSGGGLDLAAGAIAGEKPPSRKRSPSTGRNTRRSPTRRRSTAGSPRRAQGPCRARHRDRLHRLRDRQARRISLATEPNRPATFRSATAAPTCIPTLPNQLPMELVLEKLKPLLEDPAVLKIGHNLKYDWVMFDKARDRRRALRRHDDPELRPRRRAARPRPRRAGQAPLRPRVHPVQAGVRHRQEARSPSTRCRSKATEYAAEDADITLRLWLRLKPRIAASNVAGSMSGSTGRWCR